MYKAFLVAALTATALTACATSETSEPRLKGAAQFADDARLGEKVDKICHSNSINGFSEETRDTVVVSVGASKKYLIETYSGCLNLRDAGRIAFDATTSCLRKSDGLIVSDSIFPGQNQSGLGPQRCSIKAIYTWNEDAETPTEG